LQHYYQWDDYYTHRTHDRHPRRRGWTSRLRNHIAWRTDRGSPLSAENLLLLLPANALICELGCGNGNLLCDLADRGMNVVGVEPDAAAREACGERVRVLDGTAESLPDSIETGICDMVVMSHVLEHCLDPLTAMQNVHSLLRPGGLAVLAVPNNDSSGLRHSRAAWRWLDVPRHLSFFTADSLGRLCERSGLEIQSVNYDGYCRQFSDEWISEEQRVRREFGLRQRPRTWWLLTRTSLASPQRKYDTVWVVARK
jgi:SAM-dependent methyltransferase